ncbi:Down syndrome critical region protein 3 homolog [Plakobranchus ocellatus]|uniref:Vacuolar protein sorting-associated protein 26C n=1 Tax=Plakobranchus ocellatus TaxID=259542 RepID=A0AAV4AN40_9GAST|nr:Down syndrome critical region protein 3 homolog [Plakobranchus ocellatus]
MASLDIRLKKINKIYKEGDVIAGVVVVQSKGELPHQGITLNMEGMVNLLLSTKSVGLFEAFYNSLKPIQLLNYTLEVLKPGKLPNGKTEIPFELPLKPKPGKTLYETYHGVFVNIQYLIKVEMKRSLLNKDLQKQTEFIIEYKLVIESCEAPIKSIEIQLVRVETCGCAEGYAKDATEIQNIQIAEGDVVRNMPIPLYMVFPRLFTCPSLSTNNFKVVQNRFEALGDAEEVEQQWKNFKSAIMEAATEVIPKVKRKAKQKWMTEEILNLMEERRCAKGNKGKYEQIHKKVQEKCNMSKENWINEIEQQRKHALQTMYRNIEDITGKRTFLSTWCIKAMNGNIIIDKEKILERWAEYIRELLKDYNIMKNNFAGPPIMKEEVETAIKKMKHGKAIGPDNISVELIEALEDFGIGKVTHLLNEIYDTGQTPTDLCKSIFIALPKKPGATECELHRTISLMSHITKILLKIIMLRIRNNIYSAKLN